MKRFVSIGAPELVKEWSDRNADLSPDKVTTGSHKKVWWKGRCGHEWQAIIKNRVNGAGCPYCSGNRVLVGETDLRTVRPDIAAEWSDCNDGRPEDFTVNSNRSCRWKCRVCANEWMARIADRTSGSGCPYCAGKILRGFNDITMQRPDLMSEWSPKNRAGLEHEISDKADLMVWWHCRTCCKDWRANVRTRSGGGGRCPYCKKAETIRRNKLRHEEIRRERYMELILPRAAIIYYLRQLTDEISEDDSSLIGVPIDIYVPKLGLAFEVEEHVDTGASLKTEGIVKSSLCRKNNVILIKLQDESSEPFDDCICVRYARMDRVSLNSALQEIFKILHLQVDVDIERDAKDIIKGYEMSIGSNAHTK